jgi:CheY-like chemotaxis protein
LTRRKPPPLRLLAVEDDPSDQKRLRETLEPAAIEVSALSNYEQDLQTGAREVDVVSLDLLVDGRTYDAVPAAENLYEERKSRAVVFLTNRAGEARARAEASDAAHFFFEKQEEVWHRLPWLTHAAALHAKGWFLLNEAVRWLKVPAETRPAESVGSALLLEEARRYYEVLQLVQHASWAESALDGWSTRLGAMLQPIYEADYCTPFDLYRMREPFLESLDRLQVSLAATAGVTLHHRLTQDLEVLSNRLGELSHAGVVPVIRKYTDVEFPYDCVLGAETRLVLRINDEGTAGVLDLEFDDDEIELLVMVSGDGFDILEASGRLSVPRNRTSDDVAFRVIPRSTGDQYLHVHFYRGTAMVGSLIVHSTVYNAVRESKVG